MKKLSKIDYMRYTGNILTLVGYAILLNVDPIIGGIIKLVGFVLVMPSCYQLKLYDVMCMLTAFGVLDLANIIKLLLAG